MKQDDFKPTLRARLQTTMLLLDQEVYELEDDVREKNRGAMMAALQSGWREVMRIRARAMALGLAEERTRKNPG